MIRVATTSFRSVRGYTIVAAILDEVAFWRSEDSANPDVEIVNALRPAMATMPEPLLLGISSPYARRGVLWEAFKTHYGQDSPVLVWKAPTRAMNPTISEAFVAAELEKDEAAARAEYLAEFRTDIESFLSREIVEACVEPGVHARPPLDGIRYTAFVDPSGGVADSFALVIAHEEGEHAVLDAVVEQKAPLSPEAAVQEFVSLLKPYRVREVIGDRYSEELIRERCRAYGAPYEIARWSRSDLYVELLPLLTSRRVRLLDQPRLTAQLLSLERKTGASGRDSITHPRDGHDDLSNAAAGALRVLLNAAVDDGIILANPADKLAKTLHLVRTVAARQEEIKALSRTARGVPCGRGPGGAAALSPLHPPGPDRDAARGGPGASVGRSRFHHPRDPSGPGVLRRSARDAQERPWAHGGYEPAARPRPLRKAETLRHGWRELTPWVFCSEAGTPLDPNNVAMVFKRGLKAAGLPLQFTPHGLRYTFASLLLSAHVSPAYVQRQLGHATIKLTVDAYGRWLPIGNKAAIDGLDDEETTRTVRDQSHSPEVGP